MPHPFFEVPAYPWALPEAQTFYDVLVTAYTLPADINLFFKQAGGQPPLNILLPPNQMWTTALESLTTAGRLKDLCTLFINNPQAGPPVKSAAQAIQDMPDVVNMQVIGTSTFFFDRQQFRDKLSRLEADPSLSVLLIRGDRQSGKSWSRWLVFEIARRLGHPSIYLFSGRTGTLQAVLASLFDRVSKGAKPPDVATTESAGYQLICRELRKLTEASGLPFWVVMDDLGPSRLDPVIRDFFNTFVVEMGDPDFAQWFRLVLIDYPDLTAEVGGMGVPVNWLDIWDEDRPDMALVNEAALTDFVQAWARNKDKKVDPTGAAKVATDVLAAVNTAMAAPNPAKTRLKSIHDELRNAVSRL